MSYESPEAMHAAAWQMLSRGVADRRHPARHPTFVTHGADFPQARTVVLRDWRDGMAEVHTDAASGKVAELRADPRAGLHVWVPRSRLQIRLSLGVEVTPGDAAAWDRLPPAARANYGGTPPPGTRLPDPSQHRVEPVQARFIFLTCHVRRADILYLGDDLHQRTVISKSHSGWHAEWIAP